MKLVSEPVELRGIANKTNKENKVYYYLNCELEDGTPLQFFCPNSNVFAPNLKKGEKVVITFNLNRYMGKDNLFVEKVEKFVNG